MVWISTRFGQGDDRLSMHRQVRTARWRGRPSGRAVQRSWSLSEAEPPPRGFRIMRCDSSQDVPDLIRHAGPARRDADQGTRKGGTGRDGGVGRTKGSDSGAGEPAANELLERRLHGGRGRRAAERSSPKFYENGAPQARGFLALWTGDLRRAPRREVAPGGGPGRARTSSGACGGDERPSEGGSVDLDRSRPTASSCPLMVSASSLPAPLP